MMAACGEALESGSSIMIFPRGRARPTASCASSATAPSRSRRATRVPVVPIVVDGTLDVPARSTGSRCTRAPAIVIQVLEPIAPDAFADADALRVHVQQVMAAELARLRVGRGGAPRDERIAVG